MEIDDYLPIYALAEWHYCPRSAFLSWFGAERQDIVTPAYQKMREAHAVSSQPSRRDKNHQKSLTAVWLVHHGLRVTGKADAVEWEGKAPIPVEYKNCPDVPPPHIVAQLALQALCLGEMHGCEITHGFIFRTSERRRVRVELLPETLASARDGVAEFREALRAGMTGFPQRKQPGCAACIYRKNCWPEEYPYV